jgi:hypothetical protein
MKVVTITLVFFSTIGVLYGQQEYASALQIFKSESDLSNLTFKEAVLTVERTYFEGLNSVSLPDLQDKIDFIVNIAKMRAESDSFSYNKKDKIKVQKYAAVFHTITDTTIIILNGGKTQLIWLPMTYNFDDIFGTKNWANTFVSTLLETKKGNCHSLPFLYKIICEELKISCHLALAPNHIYIKHRSEKTGWYNTELTNASFPIDAWLMASGYISLEAVQKATYLDTLNQKESLSLCIVDLAQGYNHKYPDNDGKFVIECCDLALKYFPNYVNAILLKAETRLKQLQAMQKRYGYEYLKEVTVYPEAKVLWDEMNSLYMQLYKLGYRQMPEKMYVEWLTSLKTEKEKYANKQVPGVTKD